MKEMPEGEECANCSKKIINADKALFAGMKDAFLCSLECFTNWAHDEMGCEPITIKKT